MTFDQWYANHVIHSDAVDSVLLRLSQAFLAGQASAVERIIAANKPEIERGNAHIAELESKGRVTDAAEIKCLHERCAELEQDLKEQSEDYQKLGRDYFALKAQAGEPFGYWFARERRFATLDEGYRYFDADERSELLTPLFTRPTTERLPKDMGKILHDNLWELYERSPTTEPVKAQAGELDLLRTQVRELRHSRDRLMEYLERECGDRCNAEYNPCNARYLLNRIMELEK